MTKGVLNYRYALVQSIAMISDNMTKQNVARVQREMLEIEKSEYRVDLVVACWMWLRTREEFPIAEARLPTVFKGSPVYMEQFKTWIVENVPHVYEITAHDNYVRQNAGVLQALGFVYRAENMPNRLTTEDLIKLTLKDKKKTMDTDNDVVPETIRCPKCWLKAERVEGVTITKKEKEFDLYVCDNDHKTELPRKV